MTKIIVVHSCSTCPYLTYDNVWIEHCSLKENKAILNKNTDNKLPRWCPLENKDQFIKDNSRR